MSDHYFPAGALRGKTAAVELTPEKAGWKFSGLTVVEIAAGGRAEIPADDCERIVLSLSGSAQVTVDKQEFPIAGRKNVFSGTSDFVYAPRESAVTLTSESGGRFAIPSAKCGRTLPARHVAASDVPVEVRGSARSSRQVNNFAAPHVFEADKLCAVEVLTPGGNWSSYPPHKHDEHTDNEAVLEEIYYFEVSQPDGFGYQRVYSSSPQKQIDVLAEVHSGDIVLVPHGYHGPSMAAPGYDLYYLNVLAGPGEKRSMAFSDDPAHAWIRRTWAGVPADARVPFH